jgi:hypothetical protein
MEPSGCVARLPPYTSINGDFQVIGDSNMNVKELKKVVLAMDSKRKDDLLVSLVEALFDSDIEYAIDYAENMVEIVENITGAEYLTDLLPPML